MNVKEVFRGFAIIAFAIVVVLVLFIFQYAFTHINSNVELPISGKVIAIENKFGSDAGNIVIVNPPTGTPSNEVITTGGLKEEDLFASDNMRCWRQHGVSVEDALVFGEILDKSGCKAEAKKKKVSVKIVNNCLNIDIESELYALLCIDDKQPQMAIDIPTGFGVAPPIVITKSYNSAILFLIFLLSILLLWGRYEVSSFRERTLKRSVRFREGDVVEIKYIKPAPLFGEKPLQPKVPIEEIEKIHKKLLSERSVRESKELERIKLKADEVNNYIKEFNELAKEANSQLQTGNVEEARRLYLALFPIYSRLYNTLDESSKAELQMVVKYLHDQTNIALRGTEIRGLIEEAYTEAEAHRVDREKGYNALKDADRLNELIEKNKIEEAKKIFGGKTGGEGAKKKLVGSIDNLDESIDDSDENLKEAKRKLSEIKKLLGEPEK